MPKQIAIIFFFLACFKYPVAQTFSSPGRGDSLFPVTGGYYQYVDNNYTDVYHHVNFGVKKSGGKYLVQGSFGNWADNNGSSLLIDTVSKAILNNRQWRVNGDVRTAIPDGVGGFYIGGDFTAIGDSSRKYVAQISASGKPTAWKPVANGPVNVILKRNDTLFVAGAFTTFGGFSRNCFAMCKASGAMLNSNGFTGFYEISALLLNKDTIIYGGYVQNGTENIRKYNFRQSVQLTWATPFTDFSKVKHLALSGNANTIIYCGDFNGDFIKAVSNGSGAEVYYYNVNYGSSTGNVQGLKTSGNKIFAYGDFTSQQNASGSGSRRGLFAFNGNTGQLYPDNLNIGGLVSFMHLEQNKMIIGGKFTSVNGLPKEQFAMLDTGTYVQHSWQPGLSDPVTALAFNNNIAYTAGSFTGANTVNRSGLAAIDIAAHKVSSWNASFADLQGTKRMFVRGDSLFILSVRYPYGGCMVQSETTFKIISVTTGAEYQTGDAPVQNMNDMLLDGNYLYVSHGITLRRYSLPGLIYDGGWGWSWQFTGYSHSLFRLFSDASRIYAVGDSRYTTCASSIDPKRGYVDVYDKTTGQVINYYPFEGANNNYDVILFSQAELCENRMYIQGSFLQLNGVDRKNFACIDINNGSVMGWRPTFPIVTEPYSFYTASVLKEKKGKIWFGADPQLMSDGNLFYGFGAIDTITSALTQPLQPRLQQNTNTLGGTVYDFEITDSEIVLAGSFDSVNGSAYKNFAVFPITGIIQAAFCPGGGNTFISNITGPAYQWQMDTGGGFVNISNNSNFSGVQLGTLQLTNIPSAWYNYKLRCNVNGLYSDVYAVKFKNTWTGAISNNWETAGNWLCGIVPDANTDVIINSGTVVLNANTTISSLTMQTGVSLTVNPGIQLTVIH